MARRLGIACLLPGLALVACRELERTDLGPALAAGGFAPCGVQAALAASPEAGARLWRPLGAAPAEGWTFTASGWHPTGERSRLLVRPCTGTGEALELAWRRRLPPAGPVRVEAKVGGGLAAQAELPEGATTLRLALPSGWPRPVAIDLGLERPAGSAAESLALTRVGLPSAGPDPVWERQGSEWRWSPDAPGTWVAPLELPEGAVRLELEARLESRGGLRVAALDGEGARHELARLEAGAGEEWLPVGAPLEALSGRRVVLLLEVLPGARAALRRPALVGRAAGAPPEPPHVPRAARSPDVVLILLDAARGDRFTGEYARDTTPRIRAELGDALAFRRAYAECPTTSCSVPAIVTGASFLAGGDVFTGRRLPEELTTLAESLAAAGYHTVGLSASPNNAAQRNTTQGFAEFRELWGKGNPYWGPAAQVRLAVEAIAQAPRDRPLYLQLHLLPPHQPYEPPPELDRFTDPAYRGPVTPRMSLVPYSLGGATLPPADLAQLVGLYDGNVLVADDAVGQVVAALRAAGRFERSLLVVTSDHGEAFMEHGVQGHNTTLYDEMLHVPLLVRLPGSERPPAADLDRLASSLDIVPTVLGALGLPVPPEVDGMDLLGPAPDPRRPRILFHRTSAPKGAAYAVRAGRFKAIARPAQARQELYDLERDPGETEDLAFARPDLFAGLGLLLAQHLARSGAEALPTGEAVELTGEAREALEALGYVDGE